MVHHLVIIESEQLESTCGHINQMLIRFWEKGLLNVVIIFHRDDQMQIASYNPFMNEFIFYHANETTFQKLLFPGKTSNLNGQTLRATIFPNDTRAIFNPLNRTDANALDGADGLLAHLILQYMNASVYLSSPVDGTDIGEYLKNGSATGCLGQLVRGEVDFGVNVRFYRLGQFKSSVEATITNGRDDICILVPRAGKATDIGNIFRPFTTFDWIAIAVTWPAYAITYRFVDAAISTHQNRQRQTIPTILFGFLALNLAQSMHIMPTNWLKKSLIGLWLIYALLITSLYQSMLSGNLVIPKDLPDINSIEQLDRSNYKLLSYPRYNVQINDFLRDKKFNGTYRRLVKRLVNVTQDQFFKHIGEHNRTYAYANKHHINVYLRRTLRHNGEIIYNEMKQCPVPYVTVYGLTYGSPYKGRINFIIRQAQESGLMEKWGRGDMIKEKISQSKLRGERKLTAFTFTHLRTAFLVFLIGCMAAIGVFLLEFFTQTRKTFCHNLHFAEK